MVLMNPVLLLLGSTKYEVPQVATRMELPRLPSVVVSTRPRGVMDIADCWLHRLEYWNTWPGRAFLGRRHVTRWLADTMTTSSQAPTYLALASNRVTLMLGSSPTMPRLVPSRVTRVQPEVVESAKGSPMHLIVGGSTVNTPLEPARAV
jgi:hypothetical protein